MAIPRGPDETNCVIHQRNMAGSARLLRLLERHHPELGPATVSEPEPEPPQPVMELPKELPPIPNEEIAVAAEIAFPDYINATRKIQHFVCKEFNIRRMDLLSRRRTADVVLPRQVAMFLCKTFSPRSLPEIGRRFGGRDHTTVLHAVRKTKARMAADPDLRARIVALAESLGHSFEMEAAK